MRFAYVFLLTFVLVYSVIPSASAAPILSASLSAPVQVEPYSYFEAKLTLYNGGNSPAYLISPKVEVPSGSSIKRISNYPIMIKSKEKMVITYKITASKSPNPVNIKCSVSYSDNPNGKGTIMSAPCDASVIIKNEEKNRITPSYKININAAGNGIIWVYDPDRNIISQVDVRGSKKFTIIGNKAGRYEIDGFGVKKLPFPLHQNDWKIDVSKIVYLTSEKPNADVSITIK